jgi:dolichol-phosphate mannosyltransferase
LTDDVDIVSGSRYLPGSSAVGIVAPPERRALNLRITEQVNSVTGWALTDAFCGFKAYRVEALDCIKLTEAGYAMPLELWAKAWRCGLRVRELSVERIYCDHDRSFGEMLDDPETRYAYYQNVWNRALAKE